MKKLLTTTSIAMALSMPAFAGDTTETEIEQNVEQSINETGEAISNTAQAVENAVEETASDAATATQNAAENIEDVAEETAADVEQATEETASDVAEATDVSANYEGYETVAHETLTAEELTGVRVYDASEEWIGEIDEVVLSSDGSVDGAVIGVGGFLGLGEKDVLIDFEKMTLMKSEDGDSFMAVVDATKETLEQMPTYES